MLGDTLNRGVMKEGLAWIHHRCLSQGSLECYKEPLCNCQERTTAALFVKIEAKAHVRYIRY